MNIIGTGPLGFPPINKDFLKNAVRIIKTIWNVISSKLPGEISNMDSVNNGSSADDISRIAEVFEKYRKQIDEQASEIEKGVYEEVRYYIDELLFMLEQKEDILQRYFIRTKRIEKNVQKILAGINGSFDRELTKHISLDNAECKEILKMIPGTKKDEAMSVFMRTSIEAALDRCCSDIRESLNDVFDELEEQISDKMEYVKKEMELNVQNMEQIDDENFVQQTELLMTEANRINAVCDSICELLEV